MVDLTPSLTGVGELGPYLLEAEVEELGPYLLEAGEGELGPYSLVVRKGVVLEPMVAMFQQLIHLIQLDLVMQVMTPVLAL